MDSQLFDHHNTLAPRLLTPNVVTSGNSPDTQNWLIPAQFCTQDPPFQCSPSSDSSTFRPPLPSQLWSEGDPVVLPHVQLEVANPRIFMANDGPYAHPIQNQPGQAVSWALPVDRLLPWDPLPPPVYPSIIPVSVLILLWPFSTSGVRIYSQPPPPANATGPAMFESSTPVLTEVHQNPLDTACIESGQIQYASQLASSRAADRQPHLPCEPPPLEARRYNRRGKEPAAKFEPDAVKLQALCERRGGSDFAVAWILVVFMHGVTKEALFRTLDLDEIDRMGVHGGFEPRQAYDGFIAKIEGWYQCGLCKEGKRTSWRNKKDAPRHLRKFHFGLADLCKNWCVRPTVSTCDLSSDIIPCFLVSYG